MDNQRNFKITIAYKGSRYQGWQKQLREKPVPTVQEILENAAEQVFSTNDFSLHGSGRTDSGVHARAQVAHLRITTTLPPDVLQKALNAHLPGDIRIVNVEEQKLNFHAQLHVKQKTYRYFILNSKKIGEQHNWPFLRSFTWFIATPLNLSAMELALKALEGEQDFKSFQNKGTVVSHTVREILEARLIVHNKIQGDLPWMPPPSIPYELLEIRITGTGFLKQMVRTIVGTLVEIGKGRIPAEKMEAIIADKSRASSGTTAPARGLFLDHVVYKEENEKLNAEN